MNRKPRGRIVDSLLVVVLAILGVVVLVLGQQGLLIRGHAMQAVVGPTSAATAIDIGPTSPIDGPTAIVLPTTKPGQTGVPTPFPDVIIPPMTAVPTDSGPPPTRTPPSYSPQPTPLPDAPFNQTVFITRFPNTAVSVAESSFIVIGTVKDILPARWSTPDGKRPANPFAANSQAFIFRPIIVNVEQYLLGNESTQQIILTAPGGTVGQDSFEYPSDDLFTFQSGERVIVFGIQRTNLPDGSIRRDVGERYTLTSDGQAKNSLRTLALSQLLDEVRAALTPTPATTIGTPIVATPKPIQ